MVRRRVRPWRTRAATSTPALRSTQLARLVLPPAKRLRAAERTTLAQVLQAHPRLAQGYQLSTRVRTLLAARELGAFEPWVQEAATSDLPSFPALARSFRQADDVITAALTTPWSTGQGAGQSCRVKLLKRLGYGRAQLDLLGQRILPRMTAPSRGVRQRRKRNPPVAA